jgi:hypothetical protein
MKGIRRRWYLSAAAWLATAALLSVCVASPLSPRLLAQRRGRGAAAGTPARGRGDGSGTPGVKHEVKDASKRGAVCNDGSPAAFYLRPGRDPDRGKWILFFQGGAGCATDSDCSTRWKEEHNLMTSTGLPTRRQEPGLFSDDETENPDFARFTVVVIHYCSSDVYAGDTERRVDGRMLQFRGHRIVDAVVEDLQDRSVVGSPTLREATEVIVAGTSAGGMGAHNNIDRLAARLSWARVKGIFDSSWAPEMTPFGPGTLQVRPDVPAAMDYWNAQVDESCLAANPGQKGRCLSEPFLFPYLATPVFVYADQRDPVHLGTLGITGRPSSPQQQEFVDEYGRLVRESLAKVPAAFSPSLGVHTSLGTERFHSAVIDGTTLADAIGRWYFGRPGPLNLIAPSVSAAAGRGGRGAARGARGR